MAERHDLVRFDWAMKKMLRNKANYGILEGFIEVFLGKKCKIVELLESEGNQEDYADKFNRVDIKAKDSDGELFLVEIQTTRYTSYLQRVLYGVSKAITEQIEKGDSYGKIKQVFSISVVYYDLGHGKDYFYEAKTDFVGVHEHDVLQLSEREEMSVEQIARGDERKYRMEAKTASDIFPKYYLIRINAYRKVVADAMDEWMRFLKDNSIKEDTKVPGLVEAKERLRISSMSKEERLGYERHLDAVDQEKDVAKSYMEEGMKKGKIEIARNMKEEGMSIEMIAKLTGLTREEIEKM
ncbi:MAG: Rpn family recombination-promoting nuclease/putative transposase [Bacteroidales bacterium]|nr:Rpn family recombination-promoting nuclease/putative transposase [Bacteroidales bacterium]